MSVRRDARESRRRTLELLANIGHLLVNALLLELADTSTPNVRDELAGVKMKNKVSFNE